MKIKKILIVLSAMLMMLSLAGCGKEADKPFDYNDADIVLSTMEYFMNYSNVSDDIAPYYLSSGTAFEQSAVKGITQARETDQVGAFEDYSKYNDLIASGMFTVDVVQADITNSADSVMVTIINKAENRDVEISVKYVENADYFMELDKAMQYYLNYYMSMGYTPEQILAETGAANLSEALGLREMLMQNGIFPYTPEEMVVTAVYSNGELLKQAAMNTILGMGTVFIVLIFISFIISMFKFLPALFAKKAKLPEAKPQSEGKTSQTVASKDDNLMDDKELVAVITAAVYVAAGDAGCQAVSKDKLVVRSIRRVR
ncbi:MAG: OadG family protein [Lachnospiraceae bacterium]|nr:OadG family protein [Lachnospiraceae bacterium]